MLVSQVEFDDDIRLTGIVVNVDAPLQPVLVDIFFNQVLFRTERVCLPCDYRELRRLDPGLFPIILERLHGTTLLACRFEYIVPPYVPNAQSVEVCIVEHTTGQEVFREHRNFNEKYLSLVNNRFGMVLMGRLAANSLNGERLMFSGMFGCLTDPRSLGISAGNSTALVYNIAEITDPNMNPYFVGLSSRRALAVHGEVHISSDADRISLVDPTGHMVIPTSSGLAIPAGFMSEFHTWHYPSDAQIQRVMGYANRLHYYTTGYETYTMLDHVLSRFAGRKIDDFHTIIDWGCGCGRLTQHLTTRTRANVHGLDIDEQNVLWCRINLAPAEFSVVGLSPPTSMPRSYADLIIGISVFTHLHEEAQNAWLRETHRLLRPNGIAVFTIRSLHSFCTGPIATERFHNVMTRGIDDTPIGHMLDEVLKSEDFGYYRETSHSHHYVMKSWRSYFDIIGIQVGGHMNYQDVVVVRKRQDDGRLEPVSEY